MSSLSVMSLNVRPWQLAKTKAARLPEAKLAELIAGEFEELTRQDFPNCATRATWYAVGSDPMPRIAARAETVSRPPKEKHVETILYEIGMLDHCFGRLGEGRQAKGKDYYLCVEGFLLHYRNLIEFFGNHGELKARVPEEWAPRRLLRAEVASIQSAALYKKHRSPISRYLSRCSKIRAEEDRGWKHVEMYKEIEPLLENFRKLFPSSPRPARMDEMLDSESASTAIMSILSPSILLDSELIALGLRKPRE
jgi:hypothetical protein